MTCTYFLCITCSADSPTEGRVLDISYIDMFGIFVVGDTPIVIGFPFFEDLRNVKVWYGGVREDLLERYVTVTVVVYRSVTWVT